MKTVPSPLDPDNGLLRGNHGYYPMSQGIDGAGFSIPREPRFHPRGSRGGGSNIAAGRIARQSSEMRGQGKAEHRGWSPAGNALDGTSTPSMTDVGDGSWWEVDLGASSRVTSVNAELADVPCPYWIMVSSVALPAEPGSLEASLAVACEYSRHTTGDGKWDVSKTAAIARYVRVQLEGTGSLCIRHVRVQGTAVAERDGLVFDSASNRKRLSDVVGSSPKASSRDPLRIASPAIAPGKPCSYTIERGVHHLEVMSHSDAWRDYQRSWQQPVDASGRPASRSGSRSASRAGIAGGDSSPSPGPDGWTVIKHRSVRAEKGDKGTNMRERLAFQATDNQQVVNMLLKGEQMDIKASSFTGKVKSMSKDKMIVELDVNHFGPRKVTDVTGMLLHVGGEVRKIESWNRLSYKATVDGAYTRVVSKGRYVITSASFVDKWCGDLNGLRPVMSEEARREIMTQTWEMIDALDLSMLRDNMETAVPHQLVLDNVTCASVRDMIDLTASGARWWAKVAAVTAPQPRDGIGLETPASLPQRSEEKQKTALDPDAADDDEEESLGGESRASSTSKTGEKKGDAKGLDGDDGDGNGDGDAKIARKDSGKGHTHVEGKGKVGAAGKSKTSLVDAHRIKKAKARAKAKAELHELMQSIRGMLGGMILCQMFKKSSNSGGAVEEASKTIMASVVILKLAQALHGLEEARQRQNLLRHTTGPKIIRVPKALPLRVPSRF